MSYIVRSVLLLGVLAALGRHRRPWGIPIAAAALAPLLGAGLAVAIGAGRMRRRVAQRRARTAAATAELSALGELIGIGLTSGMALAEAVGFAAGRLSSDLANEVEAVRRGMALNGAASLMASAGGAAGRLYLLIGRAMVSGAPVLGAVETFVDERLAEERATRLAQLRRLPVLLLFPLALLILPGFVLLLVAPALAGALQRLSL